MSLVRNSLHLFRIVGTGNPQVTVQNTRNIHRWVAPTLKEIKKRKTKMGPTPPVNRARFIEWNLNSELFAFSKRLHEDFNPQLLQEAFTLRSFIIQEEQKQQEIGIANPMTNLKDNSDLAIIGADFLSTYVEMFISSQLPRLPRAGIQSVRDYLFEFVIYSISYNQISNLY